MGARANDKVPQALRSRKGRAREALRRSWVDMGCPYEAGLEGERGGV